MNSSPTIVQRYPKRRSVMRTTMPPIPEKQKLAQRARDSHFRAIMKISGLRAYRIRSSPSMRGATSGPAATPSPCSTRPSSPSRPMPASPAMARCARSGLPTCRRTPRARAPGSPSWHRSCSAQDPLALGALNQRMDAAHARPSLRQVGDRHGVLGHPRQGERPARLRRSWADASATTSRCTGRSRRNTPDAMAAKIAGYRAEGYRKFQLKVGGDPDDRHRAHPGRRRHAAARRRADRRRQHRLDAARRARAWPTRCATSTSTSSSRA